MIISFEVDEDVFRQAIVAGWRLRMEEEVKAHELRLVPSAFDLTCALSVMDDSKITKVEYER